MSEHENPVLPAHTPPSNTAPNNSPPSDTPPSNSPPSNAPPAYAAGKPAAPEPASTDASPASAASPIPAPAYAGFWRRFVAIVIDGIILGMAFTLINRITGLSTYWLNLTGGLFYFALMESSPYQATLGKMALGIKVTDYAGRRISFARAVGRYLGKIISSIILGIGYLLAGFSAKKQALHDMIAGTLVVSAGTLRSEQL